MVGKVVLAECIHLMKLLEVALMVRLQNLMNWEVEPHIHHMAPVVQVDV